MTIRTTTTSRTIRTHTVLLLFPWQLRWNPGSLARDGVEREHDLRDLVDERLRGPDDLHELRGSDRGPRDEDTVPDDLDRVVGRVGLEPRHHPRIDHVVRE